MYRLPSLVSQYDQAGPSISVGVINYRETNDPWSVTPGLHIQSSIGFILPYPLFSVFRRTEEDSRRLANRGLRTSYDVGSVSPERLLTPLMAVCGAWGTRLDLTSSF